MPNDNRSDEALIAAYRAGLAQGSGDKSADSPANRDNSALNALFTRYMTHVKAFLFRNSRFKDEAWIEELRQIIFTAVLEGILKGAFEDRGTGSFRAWLFEVARRLCLKHNQKRSADYKDFSQVYPESTTDIPAGLIFKASDEINDYTEIDKAQQQALAKLKPLERRLMELVGDRVEYADIIKLPEFAKYKSVDYLMLKVHNIRKRFKPK
jgi:RNA polymerase sigma factor (sigma-70 family)